MPKKKISAIAIKGFALLVVLSTAYAAMAQEATTPYPKMAPIEQYLMDRDAEIALARSAAPDAISHDASVIVSVNYWYLSAEGYPQLKSLPPMAVFLVMVDRWSDGTPAPSL